MGLYKRADSEQWWCDITINGKRIRETTGTTDRRQAQEYHDKLKAESWRVTHMGDKPQYTWQETVVRYLKESAGLKRLNDDLPHLRWLNRYLGNKRLVEINRDLLEFIAAERFKPYEEHHLDKQGNVTKTVTVTVKAATVKRTIDRLTFVLRQAQGWGWLDAIPSKPTIQVRARKGRELPADRCIALLNLLPLHLRDVCEFSLETGLRQSNALGLRWDWVFLQERMVVIPDTHFKQGRAHGLPLSGRAAELVSARRGDHPEYVFTYRGAPMQGIQSKTWKKYLVLAGLDRDTRWHDLRHTWASRKVRAGVPLRSVQEMAGWASLSMVERYSHLQVQHLLRYADTQPTDSLATTSRFCHGDVEE